MDYLNSTVPGAILDGVITDNKTKGASRHKDFNSERYDYQVEMAEEGFYDGTPNGLDDDEFRNAAKHYEMYMRKKQEMYKNSFIGKLEAKAKSVLNHGKSFGSKMSSRRVLLDGTEVLTNSVRNLDKKHEEVDKTRYGVFLNANKYYYEKSRAAALLGTAKDVINPETRIDFDEYTKNIEKYGPAAQRGMKSKVDALLITDGKAPMFGFWEDSDVIPDYNSIKSEGRRNHYKELMENGTQIVKATRGDGFDANKFLSQTSIKDFLKSNRKASSDKTWKSNKNVYADLNAFDMVKGKDDKGHYLMIMDINDYIMEDITGLDNAFIVADKIYYNPKTFKAK